MGIFCVEVCGIGSEVNLDSAVGDIFFSTLFNCFGNWMDEAEFTALSNADILIRSAAFL